ncbi:HhH-GPD-type base excision DNA repair protein [Humidisolicoccus flavus]|uniref:HhH-GPD-type base excision DNA repair protein n=1 Tax=Humidisolicoccus flavus TaxID=3111414 RepID=UPI00324B34BC
MPEIHITNNTEADKLLSNEPFALLLGMLLDQQVAMETAFAGPEKLRARLGAQLSPKTIVSTSEDELEAMFKESPAVHRFPGSMAKRTRALCEALIEEYEGDASKVWSAPNEDGSAPSGADVVRRLGTLPGFGAQKSKIFLALLGKQYGVEPAGWRAASEPYGEEGSLRSVADIVDEDSLQAVRAAKKAAKAKAKG